MYLKIKQINKLAISLKFIVTAKLPFQDNYLQFFPPNLFISYIKKIIHLYIYNKRNILNKYFVYIIVMLFVYIIVISIVIFVIGSFLKM